MPHRAVEASSAPDVLLSRRHEMVRLGVEERIRAGLLQMIVAMLGLHIDQWLMGNSRRLDEMMPLASGHRIPLISTRNRRNLLATCVELWQ